MKARKKFLALLITLLILMTGGCGSSPSPAAQNESSDSDPDELDFAIRDASDYLNDNIPEGSMIVILNMQSDSSALSEYIIDELIANAVNDHILKVVDRQQLDLIRTEQNFQLSGEVDDDIAVSIGKLFGAQTIVSGRVRQLDDRFRMTIRALEVQTAQVQGQYNRNIAAGKTITALMRSGGGTGTQTTSVRTTGSGNSGTASTSGTNSATTARAAPTPTVTSVTISPDTVSVDKGKTHQFEAAVIGTNDPDLTVTWAVTGNTSSKTHISEDGVLTVGDDENITPLTVTATSTQDRSKNGRATVSVPGGISAINVSSVSNWNTAINTIRNGGNNKVYMINVTGTVSVPAPSREENLFGSVTGITVNIQGNGTLALSVNGSLLSIAAGQTVVVRDVTLRGRTGNNANNNAPVVYIRSGGIFRMEGRASVTGNTNTSNNGGGVFVGSNANFIMQGSASVTNNNAEYGGGGIWIDNGGNFIMYGGTISGNRYSGNGGGGVRIQSRGTFTMQGGTISGNTGKGGLSGGGGVDNSGGTFIMSGGTISGNTTDRDGGGVFSRGGTFTMQGGTITGSNNAKTGGGVFVWGTTFTKTGGTISGNDSALGGRNSATRQGHAIYWDSSPTRWRNATAGPDDNTAGYGFWLND